MSTKVDAENCKTDLKRHTDVTQRQRSVGAPQELGCYRAIPSLARNFDAFIEVRQQGSSQGAEKAQRLRFTLFKIPVVGIRLTADGGVLSCRLSR